MQPIVGTGGFDDMIIKRAQEWTKSTSIHFERTLEIEGVSYLVIYGEHINGGFIAIPNWNICCEAASGSSNISTVHYNAERLVLSGLDEETAITIARYIDDYIFENDRTILVDNCDMIMKLMGKSE